MGNTSKPDRGDLTVLSLLAEDISRIDDKIESHTDTYVHIRKEDAAARSSRMRWIVGVVLMPIFIVLLTLAAQWGAERWL